MANPAKAGGLVFLVSIECSAIYGTRQTPAATASSRRPRGRRLAGEALGGAGKKEEEAREPVAAA
jgi:hypothetical protein